MDERFFYDVVILQKKGLFYPLLRGILRVFSLFFYGAITLRRALYRIGIKRSFQPSSLTIVVGNITAGGTGKTPFTIFLAEKFAKKMSCAILTSGYRSGLAYSAVAEMAPHRQAEEHVGDEALLIRRHLPEAALFVGRDRVACARQAQKNARCLILDDGLQHLALAPHVRIAMVDATCPFGGGYLLPRGLLREPLSTLQEVDLIVIHRVDLVHAVDSIETELSRCSSAPILHSQFVFSGWYDQSGTHVQLSKGARVALFCGIAKPEQFLQLVKNQGLDVVISQFGSDHVGLCERELAAFVAEAKKCGAEACVCTEKDIVRFTKHINCNLPLYWAKGRLEIVKGEELLDKCLLEWEARI